VHRLPALLLHLPGFCDYGKRLILSKIVVHEMHEKH
jgi:hypothetical protein